MRALANRIYISSRIFALAASNSTWLSAPSSRSLASFSRRASGSPPPPAPGTIEPGGAAPEIFGLGVNIELMLGDGETGLGEDGPSGEGHTGPPGCAPVAEPPDSEPSPSIVVVGTLADVAPDGGGDGDRDATPSGSSLRIALSRPSAPPTTPIRAG